MKKFLFPALLLFAFTANAQIKYGLKAGVNFANITIKSSGMSISPESQTSYHVTGFADIGISEKFSFQPGLSLQGKGYKMVVSESDVTIKGTANVAYLEVPLNGVLYLPAGKGDIFLGAGPYIAFGLFGKSTVDSNVPDFDIPDEDAKFGNSAADNVSPIDFGLNFMAGYQLKSGLLFNAGYGLGLGNTIPKDAREDDSKQTNKVFSISIGYSF